MSVIEFARRLLRIWGGTLSEVKDGSMLEDGDKQVAFGSTPGTFGSSLSVSAEFPSPVSYHNAAEDSHTFAAVTQPSNESYDDNDDNDNDDDSNENAASSTASGGRGIPQKEPRKPAGKEPRDSPHISAVGTENDPSAAASALWGSAPNNSDDDGMAEANDAGEDEAELSDDSEMDNEVQERSEAAYGTPNEYEGEGEGVRGEESASGDDAGSDDGAEVDGSDDNENAGDIEDNFVQEDYI
jgi:hypothetical protein